MTKVETGWRPAKALRGRKRLRSHAADGTTPADAGVAGFNGERYASAIQVLVARWAALLLMVRTGHARLAAAAVVGLRGLLLLVLLVQRVLVAPLSRGAFLVGRHSKQAPLAVTVAVTSESTQRGVTAMEQKRERMDNVVHGNECSTSRLCNSAAPYRKNTQA
jgi:hypothetical protein